VCVCVCVCARAYVLKIHVVWNDSAGGYKADHKGLSTPSSYSSSMNLTAITPVSPTSLSVTLEGFALWHVFLEITLPTKTAVSRHGSHLGLLMIHLHPISCLPFVNQTNLNCESRRIITRGRLLTPNWFPTYFANRLPSSGLYPPIGYFSQLNHFWFMCWTNICIINNISYFNLLNDWLYHRYYTPLSFS